MNFKIKDHCNMLREQIENDDQFLINKLSIVNEMIANENQKQCLLNHIDTYESKCLKNIKNNCQLEMTKDLFKKTSETILLFNFLLLI